MQKVAIFLPGRLLEALEDEAGKRGISRSEVVRRVLEAWEEERRKQQKPAK